MRAWLTRHRWTILGLSVLVYLIRLVVGYWLEGALSTPSFVILGVTAAFEIGCAWYLLRGIREWREDPYRIDLEDRRAIARAPRKRFGNAPEAR